MNGEPPAQASGVEKRATKTDSHAQDLKRAAVHDIR